MLFFLFSTFTHVLITWAFDPQIHALVTPFPSPQTDAEISEVNAYIKDNRLDFKSPPKTMTCNEILKKTLQKKGMQDGTTDLTEEEKNARKSPPPHSHQAQLIPIKYFQNNNGLPNSLYVQKVSDLNIKKYPNREKLTLGKYQYGQIIQSYPSAQQTPKFDQQTLGEKLQAPTLPKPQQDPFERYKTADPSEWSVFTNYLIPLEQTEVFIQPVVDPALEAINTIGYRPVNRSDVHEALEMIYTKDGDNCKPTKLRWHMKSLAKEDYVVVEFSPQSCLNLLSANRPPADNPQKIQLEPRREIPQFAYLQKYLKAFTYECEQLAFTLGPTPLSTPKSPAAKSPATTVQTPPAAPSQQNYTPVGRTPTSKVFSPNTK